MPPEPEALTAHENPLIPNDRLRRIYAAILHARLLGDSLPKSQRLQTRGLEAAFVSTSVDLAANDLVSDALSTPVLDHLRATSFTAPTHDAATPPLNPQSRVALTAWATPSILPPAPTIADRFSTAIGAAASLRAAAAKSKSYAKAKGGTLRQPGVVIAYTQPGELPPSLWQKTLAFVARHELPIIFVTLPSLRTKIGNTPIKSARLSAVIAIALRNHVPGITVDANDPIALYRVAQESIARARIGGGPTLIECTPFAVHGSHTPPEDALPNLERYLLQRHVATRAWMDREAKVFTRRLASNKKK
jgi:hypothetical protein